MSSRKTAKGAKVDKAVHDQLAAELDESKEDNVRDNERLKKDLKAAWRYCVPLGLGLGNCEEHPHFIHT
jgi:hypothetical protein